MKNHKRRIKFCIAYFVLSIVMTSLFTTTTIAAVQYNNMRLAVGDSHALLIDQDGNIWAFGNNSSGQLGDGSTASKNSPIMVYSKGWKGRAISVAAGSRQSLALLEDGTVLIWGYGNAVQRTAFAKKASAIAAGGDKCLAILQTGDAVCWSDTSSTLPIKNESGTVLRNVKEIAAGSNDFLILRAGTGAEGSVYQLHLSPARDYWIASGVEIGTDADASSDSSSSSATPVTTLTADSISAGAGYGVALSAGDVYTWGTNSENGVLGQGTFDVDGVHAAEKVSGLPSIQQISAGLDHVIVIDHSGNAFGWGNARNKRLDAKKSDPGYALPEPINIGIAGISQFDCGNTWNVALNSAGEFFSWGNDKAAEKLTLKQTLLKTPTPSIVASLIGDQMMTIKWKPEEFYTEIALGFIVTYTTPNGTVGKTQLLPLTISQITLRGLQPATNYKITLSILGKTGYEDIAPIFVVQTAKASNQSSSSSSIESQIDPSVEPTNTQSAGDSSSSESSGAGQEKSVLYTLFRLILIILIVLALSTAVIAFLYLWKRFDKEKQQRIKPVRVTSDGAAPSDTTGTRDPASPDNNPGKEDSDMKIVTNRESLNSIVPGLIEELPLMPLYPTNEKIAAVQEPANNESDEPENPKGPRSDEKDRNSEEEDEFLTRLPDVHGYNDEEDDFIIRKPGEPKK